MKRLMNFGLDLRPSLARPTGAGAYVLALAQCLPGLADLWIAIAQFCQDATQGVEYMVFIMSTVLFEAADECLRRVNGTLETKGVPITDIGASEVGMDEGCNFSAGSKGRVPCLFEEFDRFFFAACAFEFDPDVHLGKSEKVRFTQLLGYLVHFDIAL